MTTLERVNAELERYNEMYDNLQKENWNKENFEELSKREDLICEMTSTLAELKNELEEELDFEDYKRFIGK